jgi:hypothetical protein
MTESCEGSVERGLVAGNERGQTALGAKAEVSADGGYFAEGSSTRAELSYFEWMISTGGDAEGVVVKDETVRQTLRLKPVGEGQTAALPATHAVKFVLKLNADFRFG